MVVVEVGAVVVVAIVLLIQVILMTVLVIVVVVAVVVGVVIVKVSRAFAARPLDFTCLPRATSRQHDHPWKTHAGD